MTQAIDEGLAAVRLAACRSCPRHDGSSGRCRSSGMLVAITAGMPAASCPERRWAAVEWAARHSDPRPCLDCAWDSRSEASWIQRHRPLLEDLRGATALPPGPALFRPDFREYPGLRDRFPGRAGVIVGGGPSLSSIDPFSLSSSGLITIVLNNACACARPTVWLAVDDPSKPIRPGDRLGRFPEAPWADPGVLKVLPMGHRDAPIPLNGRPGNLPATAFFVRGETWDPADFLDAPCWYWGEPTRDGIANQRSVLWVALKLAWYLGLRRLGLLGLDFRMNPDRPYAHGQPKDVAGCDFNNRKFAAMNDRLAALRSSLERAGMSIRNGTPNSGLTAFEVVPAQTLLESLAAR